MSLQNIRWLVALAFTHQMGYKFFRKKRRFKSFNFTVHSDIEPGVFETYFGPKLVILGVIYSSRQCQKVSQCAGEILKVFTTSAELGRLAKLREAAGALDKTLDYKGD